MDRIDRLNSLLGENTWEPPAEAQEEDDKPFERYMFPDFTPDPRDEILYSDTDDDEKILNADHMTGGRFEQPVGRLGVVKDKTFDIPKYGLKFSEEIESEESFCHLNSLIRYPYERMSLAYRKKVAEAFFEKGKVYDRQWDLFYIYPPYQLSQKAILLIPTIQVEQFFHEINVKFRLNLQLPSDTEAFTTSFAMDGTPRPRYLGCSTEREMAEGLKLAVPSDSWRPDSEPQHRKKPSDRSLEAYRKKIERLSITEKKKKASVKAKKTAERVAKQQSWGRQVKRVQRYLGLRESTQGNIEAARDSLKDSNLQWTEYDNAFKAALEKVKPTNPFSYDVASTISPEHSVVFICVDIEAWERNHNQITEIGIATLDTAELVSLAPGTNGENWMSKIRGSHYRISEYKHLVNRDFVTGCPDQFHFGESEFVSIADAVSVVASCFKPTSSTTSDKSIEEPRNIVLVGHDLKTDVEYLRKMGYDPSNLSNLLESIDTSFMYRALRREQNPRNLGSVLAELELTGWWLHNAGNDAVYTMQAMVAIALKDMAERQEDRDAKKEAEKKERIEQVAKEAVEKAIEQQNGWSSGSDDDGGEAPKKSDLASANGDGPDQKPAEDSSKSTNTPWK